MRHDPAKRDELASDVRHELKMLAFTVNRLGQQTIGNVQDPTGVSHAVGESFLVHLRLLDDFLGATSRGPHHRDVLAEDFNPDWTPQRVLTQTERDEIGGKVVHLADDRVAGFPWPLSDLFLRTFDRFEQFVEGCQECHDHFDAVLDELRPLVQAFRPGG